MTKKQKERDEARARLLEMLKPGDTVHTVLRHVSRSGMSRSISAIIYDEEGNNYNIDYLVSQMLDCPCDPKNGGVKMGGCGMDMGGALVHALSAYLWPNGHDCTGEGCPSNDHSNGDRDYTPHHHNDCGYALKQRWI
jgi:hypothetical protein